MKKVPFGRAGRIAASLALSLTCVGFAQAQENPNPPANTASGNASAPAPAANAAAPGANPNIQTQTFQDWNVRCGTPPAPQGSTATPPRRCVMIQEVSNTETKQRVMAVEMRPDGDGAVATMVLPFGLSLSRGIAVSVDSNAPTATLPFRTCLPIGCLVPTRLDSKVVASMRRGNKLNVKVTADNGEQVTLAFSLAGFSKALEQAGSGEG